MKTTFVLLAFALVAINSAYGRKCYICKNCAELPDKAEQVECKDADAPNTTVKPDITTTEKVETTTDGTGGGAQPPSNNNPIFANKYDRADEKDEYNCVTYTTKFFDGTMVNRDCIKAESCDKVKESDKDKLISDCDVCKEDGCNPANNIKSWALSSVILVAIIKMFL